jgi:PDZ domain-containing secreted protein
MQWANKSTALLKKIKMVQINSTRKYSVVFIEGDSTFSGFFDIVNILQNNDDYEWKNAVNESIDQVLDLKVGERLSMKFNRDNSDSDGFIKRIE